MDRARAGDDEALGVLLSRSRGRLDRIARREMGERMRGRFSVSDIVQSAYFEALRDFGSFQGSRAASLEAWLVSVLRNKVRKRARSCRDFLPCEEDLMEAGGDSPSREVMGSEDVERVRRAIGEMPPREGALIIARARGWSSRRIAELLGVSEVQVRTRVRRARLELAQRLD